MKTNFLDFLNEKNTNLDIKPNLSRFSGFSKGLVYTSISKSYASAYANGETSAAHVYKFPINNGVLFSICFNENTEHYGGDVWVSGYKDDIINNIKEYISNPETNLENLTKDFIQGCGLSNEPTKKELNYILNYIKNDNLSIISPLEWSMIQEDYSGYSEICVKEITFNQLIKVELYQNEELIKTIQGGYDEDECETVFYHGSPLIYWKHLL